MADLLELARAPFDGDAAFAAYCRWEMSGDDDAALFEAAFHRALPATGVIYRSGFSSSNNTITVREFISSAALILYRDLKRRAFHGDLPDQYARWLFISSHNAFIDERRGWSANRIFNFDYHGPRAPRGSLYDVQDVEHAIFIEQLPREIVARVSPKIRFDGMRRLACFYILRQLLGGGLVPTRYVRKHFGIWGRDLEFLMDYVAVRIRMALYEIKADLCHGKVVDDWIDAVAVYGPKHWQVAA